jgi:hypothetical protein
VAFPEQCDRVAQIPRHLRLCYVSDLDAPPRKVVNELSRIGAVVPGNYRTVSLAGQYDPEFGD